MASKAHACPRPEFVLKLLQGQLVKRGSKQTVGFLLVLEGCEAVELKLQLISGVRPELFWPGPVHPSRVCRSLLLTKTWCC